MPIGIDCDEVIFPFLLAHCIFLNRKYPHLNLDWREFTRYNFWERYGGTREQAVQDFIEFTATKEFEDILPAEGSQEGARELRKLDELYVITARTDALRDKTQAWLDRHFAGLFSKIVFGSTFSNGEKLKTPKRELCRREGIWLLLEDNLDYAREVAAADIQVILFDKPWNQQAGYERNITRVKTIEKTERTEKMLDWQQAVAVAEFIK